MRDNSLSRRRPYRGTARPSVPAVLCTALVSMLAISASAWSAPGVRAYHIVGPRKPLSAGEQIEIRLEPAPPAGTYITWVNATAIGAHARSDDARLARYTAPFVIPPGAAAVEIRALLSSTELTRLEVIDHVDLVPSTLPDAQTCLASGQMYSSASGTILPADFAYVRAAHALFVPRHDPVYPPMAVSRGLTGRVFVRALLCASGNVLAAYPEDVYRGNELETVEYERAFMAAALELVPTRTFPPVQEDGIPVAGWIHVQVVFGQ
jgi:hypothetical protein